MTPYYQDAAVTLYHGDCRAIWPQCGSIDHVITDPPYSAETHGKTWRSKKMAESGHQKVSAAFDGLGFDALSDLDAVAFVKQYAAKARRWTLLFSDIEGVSRWIAAIRASGLDYIRTCVWDKVDGTPQLTGDRPAVGAEAIVMAHPAGRKHWNGGGKRGVYRHATNGGTGVKPHPSTKPLALMMELIADFTDPGAGPSGSRCKSNTAKAPPNGWNCGLPARSLRRPHDVGSALYSPRMTNTSRAS